MIASILTGLVAALHLYFLYLEMFAWDTTAGRKAFAMTAEFSAQTKALAANQGPVQPLSLPPASPGVSGWATAALPSATSS